MVEHIRQWVLGLCGASVLCALALELTPPGAVKRVLRAVCGVVLTAALLLPLYSFDYSGYSLFQSEYREQADALARQGVEISRELNRGIIEETLGAYILDKAQALGAQLEGARVTAAWSGRGSWYPVSAELDGPYHAALSDYIEGELGIARQAQKWGEDVYEGQEDAAPEAGAE